MDTKNKRGGGYQIGGLLGISSSTGSMYKNQSLPDLLANKREMTMMYKREFDS